MQKRLIIRAKTLDFSFDKNNTKLCYRCVTHSGCETRYPKEDFINFQTKRETTNCKKCRENNKQYDKRKLEKRKLNKEKLKLTNNEKERYCNDCNKKQNIDKFTGDNNICDKHLELAKIYRENRKNREIEKIKDSDGNLKFCKKCNSALQKSNFINDLSLCINCRKKCKINSKKYYNKEKEKLIKKINEVEKEGINSICIQCREIKKLDQFTHLQTDEKVKMCLDCRKSWSEYMKPRRDDILQKYIEMKLESKCEICGFDDYRAIEFDHIDREDKKFVLHHAPSVEKLIEERAKVRPLCVLCHTRVNKENNWYSTKNPEEHSKNYNRILPLKKRNKEYVNNIKKEIGGCQECGWFDETLLEGLDFDHINREDKTNNVSFLVCHGRAIETIQKEIDKCRLLCKICHKIRTIEQRGYSCY
jgi:hypothetical protein